MKITDIGIVCCDSIWRTKIESHIQHLKGEYTVMHVLPTIESIKGNYFRKLFYHPTVLWDMNLKDMYFRSENMIQFKTYRTIQKEIDANVKASKEEITKTRKSSGF